MSSRETTKKLARKVLPKKTLADGTVVPARVLEYSYSIALWRERRRRLQAEAKEKEALEKEERRVRHLFSGEDEA